MATSRQNNQLMNYCIITYEGWYNIKLLYNDRADITINVTKDNHKQRAKNRLICRT